MTIPEKLLKVQTELKAPKGQFNTFGKYKYRSAEDILEAVKPLLQTNELTITLSDEPVLIGNRIYIKATATAGIGEEGAVSVSAFAREPESKKGMDESQITGTASSYARKYALNGLLLIDDNKDADSDEYAKQTKQNNQNTKQPMNRKPATNDPNAMIAKVGQMIDKAQKNYGASTEQAEKWSAMEPKKAFDDIMHYVNAVEGSQA
ncbi:hypothetical protein ESZ50_05700 [Weissella muntiaci]|uniref:Single-stranded DNA-binding protein n=1 Tax=Weissella muntiaci TaxID=2508881 RepID=A0A6C2C751_9LACO|nr:ERF family protein [Weissella muntiaci]TYC49637.1 hypothetical protein ESZ50_05700 [Weissella muntiaci]